MLYRPESAIFAHLFSEGTLNHGPNRQLPALVMGCQLDDDVADDKHQQLSVIAGKQTPAEQQAQRYRRCSFHQFPQSLANDGCSLEVLRILVYRKAQNQGLPPAVL